ncbi:MAG TPA: hypothetical protein VFI39_04675 [Gemmatimonadales bacterium]|nr:hypothetical protein [Gemmatimonadales bacterium]
MREWAEYERVLTEGNSVVGGRELLDDVALRLEEIYLGLRTVDGVPQDRLPAPVVANWVDEGWAVTSPPDPLGAASFDPLIATPLGPRSSSPPDPLSTFVERGSEARVRLTPEGWLRLDALVGMVG